MGTQGAVLLPWQKKEKAQEQNEVKQLGKSRSVRSGVWVRRVERPGW